MRLNGARRTKPRPRGELIAVLDVGSTKVVCFIGRTAETGQMRIVGIGHQVSQGVRAGTVVDMDAAERAIGHAVSAAEQMAGETIREVVVSLSGGLPNSQTVSVEIPVAGREIGPEHVRQAMRGFGLAQLLPEGEVVHAIPVNYAIDGSRGIRDPRGMYGDRLSVDIHLVTAGSSAMRNLATCINRCHLEVEAFVVSPYASGLACLVEDEMELGCTVIDLGGGTTGISVFFDGKMVFTDCIPVGGAHITNDIARGLTTPLAHAERMKVLHGCALPNVSDEREMIDVPQVGEHEPSHTNQVPKSLLTGIIQPRVEEMFELVRSRLEASGFDKVAGRRVVLTGGGSQLQSIRELAQLILDKQIRMGRPNGTAGLAEATGGPAFATGAGLMAYAARHQGDFTVAAPLEEAPAGGGLWERFGGWLRAYL